ncbi:hypothetical protein [Thiobaca trueperi]|uniref:Uncharacterized protein n=1 Tax=Thiobaca trueperi TaxID=127458 RepID=A0A4R3MSP9_9GAMM|nr:hypothetical protein [Thiobaca trueperi]TCT19418.1 hypothetical protein EDC35_10824 [Thiobaca trueperi]
MMTGQSFSRTALIAATLALTAIDAQAQTEGAAAPIAVPTAAPAPMAVPEPAPAVTSAPAPAVQAESAFDGYQALAVSAGVIGGAVIAGILTEGLIVPLYCWATGSAGMGAGAGAGMGAGMGAGAAGSGAGMGAQAFKGVMQTLGAVGGGFYGNAWYQASASQPAVQ